MKLTLAWGARAGCVATCLGVSSFAATYASLSGLPRGATWVRDGLLIASVAISVLLVPSLAFSAIGLGLLGRREGAPPVARASPGTAIVLGSSALVAALSHGLFLAWQAAMFGPVQPLDPAPAIEAAREWARLDTLPASASDIEVSMRGSPFTRQFRVAFRAPAKDVRAWIERSPGTRTARRQARPDGSVHYQIEPGGGAASAKVVVSPDGKEVLIDASWS